MVKAIRSDEREPSKEGEYFCFLNGKKVVLNFVIIKPNKDNFVLGDMFDEGMLDEIRFWTKNVNNAEFIRSNHDLLWLEGEFQLT